VLPDSIGSSSLGEVRYALLNVVAPIIRDLSHRPTHVTELTYQPLDYTGYCDTSAFVAEGVWFGAKAPLSSIVRRIQWATPWCSTGTPTADLEMVGMLFQEKVPEARLGPEAMRGIPTVTGSDNSPAFAWTTRMVASRKMSSVATHFQWLKNSPDAMCPESFSHSLQLLVSSPTAALLAQFPAVRRPMVARDSNAVWRTIKFATMDQKERRKAFRD
jgi:hypothetical protein